MLTALITVRTAKAKYVTLLTEGKHGLSFDSSIVKVRHMWAYINWMISKSVSSVALNAKGLYTGCAWLQTFMFSQRYYLNNAT